MVDLSTLSQKQINKIGKRFRDSIHDENDFNLLEDFKKSYDEHLISYSSKISKDLNKFEINYVMAGRLKRTISIIRKLQRPKNKGMDLTRMSDIAGIRIIVETLKDEKIYNYVETDQDYKSIHLIIKENTQKLIEVQIRTLAQQTWADESEEFGEQAKQGFMKDEVGKYLSLLSNLMYRIDKGEEIEQNKIDNHLLDLKSPIKGKFQIIKREFKVKFNYHEKPQYFLIVYDRDDSTLVSKDMFEMNQRNEIFDLYKYKSNILDENKFEIIFFVSSLSDNALRVSHPRFFIR